MLLLEFKNSFSLTDAPQGLTQLQLALWHSARGNWNEAHNIAQQYEGQKDFDRLHSYLHRVEGDEWNANYWYRRAGEHMPACPPEEELDTLMDRWLSNSI